MTSRLAFLVVAGCGRIGFDAIGPTSDGAVTGDATLRTCAGPSFSSPAFLDTGVFSDPTVVAVEDFNKDGKLDLAAASGTETRLSVFLGKGDGTFQPAVFYSAAYDAESIVAGDFNGDGRQDLAATSSGNTVSVLLGNGDGTFQSYSSVVTGAYQWWIAAGYLDANASLDLVTANLNSLDVSVLLGNGNGTFQPHVDYALGSSLTSVAIGDVNRDGRQDLIAVGFSSLPVVSLLFGNGDGTFQPYVDVDAKISPLAVIAGDVNLDGKPDLIVTEDASSTGAVAILLGHGDGTFEPAVTYAAGRRPRTTVIVDVNQDSKPDLVTANEYGVAEGTVSVMFGAGDGTFVGTMELAAGIEPWSVSAGDLDGDGKPDLAVADYGMPGVSVLLNTCLP